MGTSSWGMASRIFAKCGRTLGKDQYNVITYIIPQIQKVIFPLENRSDLPGTKCPKGHELVQTTSSQLQLDEPETYRHGIMWEAVHKFEFMLICGFHRLSIGSEPESVLENIESLDYRGKVKSLHYIDLLYELFICDLR